MFRAITRWILFGGMGESQRIHDAARWATQDAVEPLLAAKAEVNVKVSGVGYRCPLGHDVARDHPMRVLFEGATRESVGGGSQRRDRWAEGIEKKP